MNEPAVVRVHIERLVIDGAPGVRADLLTDALIDELTRLAAKAAPPDDVPGELSIDLLRQPVAGGRAIAAALHARLLAEATDG